ncbi:hypothetical protein OAM07_00030 [Crocinitomicaceae bacterium]|nr:hypothetical protein [Crocinitomicaceae bacterium]
MNQSKCWLYQVLDNITIMKFILFFVVLFFAIYGFGQPPENSTFNSTNSNQEIQLEEEIKTYGNYMDSVAPVSKKQESREFNKDKVPKRNQENLSPSSSFKVQSSQVLELESNKVKYQISSRSPSVESQKVMDSEVEQLRNIDDESFEYHLYNYVSGNYDVTRQESLYRAEAIDGNNQEVQRLIVANSIATGDDNATRKRLVKLVNNGTLSKETISYTDDVLESAKGNEILITHGTNDSYGTIYNQLIQGPVFNSICIVSLDLLKSSSYRELIKGKGVKVPNREVVDIQFFIEMCNLNSNKGISISMTFPLEYLKPMASQLVPYGLVLRTGKQKPLCASDLDDLWNQGFNKKNLNEYTSPESRNYAKNYRPTKVILKKFHDSNKSNDYMNSTEKKRKKGN